MRAILPNRANISEGRPTCRLARSTSRVLRGQCLSTVLGVLAVLGAGPLTVAHADEETSAQRMQHFEQHVRPVLVNKCLKCHGRDKQEGGLRLDSQESVLKGGDSGPALVPEQPDASLIIQAVHYDGREMPPTERLEDRDIRHLEHWVRTGAAWPADLHELRPNPHGISAEDRSWWAFQPLPHVDIPSISQDNWSRNPIDRFVLQKLQSAGLTPAPQARPEVLIRRLFFDVIGLPPTPEDIDAFVADSSENAWAALVDRLLFDPRYGEHWARGWLDLVRYAESDGWNQDAYRSQIWRYRDYVVKSLNADKPYADFVREQLAGDELDPNNPEFLAAAGFLRLGVYEYNQRDARGQWNDIMNEMTDVTADVFLGMGVACARCHDHKFDPILQADYFRLRAFFEPVIWRDDILAATPQEKAVHQAAEQPWLTATADIRAALDQLLKPYHDKKWASTADKFPLDIQACFFKPVDQRNSWEHQMAYLVSRQYLEEGGGPLKALSKSDQAEYDRLQKELEAFNHLKPAALGEVMTVSDFPGPIAPTVIPDRPGAPQVGPGILTVLAPSETQIELAIPAMPQTSGRRLALAGWISRTDNALTHRVIVNRIWQQHFGQGIVSTANDFGHQGQLPTHPELLDWLTQSFIEHGGRFRHLHRMILTSATWRQSAEHPLAEDHQSKDRTDSLLWRSKVRRLKAEQIRDAMLACSGELQLQPGGPSVDAATPRRGLYVKTLRNTPDPFLHAFDSANGLQSLPERSTTTTPLQALLMVNGEYTLARAQKMAERLQSFPPSSPDELITNAFRLTWGRPPSPDELRTSHEFLKTEAAGPEAAESISGEKLADLCHVLLNSNEFLYVD